jgi:4-hydroxythreonine-4-phosphate dehydrogenase
MVGDVKVFKKFPFFNRLKKRINLIDINTPGIEKVKFGYGSELAGKASLGYLNKSLEIMKEYGLKRLVTAPLSKESVKLVLPGFCGHTEYLASYFNKAEVVMLMVSGKLKVAMLTRHIPLREVSSFVSEKAIVSLLSIVYHFFKKQFKIKSPRIVMAAFNPHAGRETFLEKEENKMLRAMEKFQRKVSGPYPADTVFVKDNLKKYDCVICTYHDQAMIPFKLLSMQNGVNVTLGLPVIRTSPAHGVAYDVMRRGKIPFHSSMVEAIRLALKLSV